MLEFNFMSRKRKLSGGFMVIAGYLLSPLSWWNDLYINIPLAYSFAWFASLLYEPAFLPALIVFYWITNIAGFILMHMGATRVLRRKAVTYSKRELLIDLAWSLAYTILVIILVKLNIIRPVTDYL